MNKIVSIHKLAVYCWIDKCDIQLKNNAITTHIYVCVCMSVYKKYVSVYTYAYSVAW